MADFPNKLEQNPSPLGGHGQQWHDAVERQADAIMGLFQQMLPSNYVSRVPGPHYWLQFRAAAVELAKIQIEAQEVYKDSDYQTTRPEFLFQMIGQLVHPEANVGNAPVIDGDKSYRAYLSGMVKLLLAGATKASVKAGVELLTGAEVTVLEKALEARDNPGSAWGTTDDQFTFEVSIKGANGQAWPEEDPFTLKENVALALRALRPAHTLYTYRNLFTEAFSTLFTATVSYDMSAYYYEDFRRNWWGAEAITGTSASINAARTRLTDTSRDFSTVQAPATCTITTGANAGQYRVTATEGLPFTTDATANAYTTSPTGLIGTATVAEGIIVDVLQNWAQAAVGELLTFTTGNNLGTYRLGICTGNNGGPVGTASGPSTGVTVLPTTLVIRPQPPSAIAAQAYRVDVDRLGVTTPQTVVGEDASNFFTL